MIRRFVKSLLSNRLVCKQIFFEAATSCYELVVINLLRADDTRLKNFTKGYRSVVTHVLYYFCDMSLITACAIFCSVMFHVVCTCTICLLTNRKMMKTVTLIDLHIVLTYDG